MSDRKPRSDSKLDNLPELQFLELRDGLLASRWSYEEALSWLEAECGVSSSLASLSGFYKRHCKPLVMSRRKWAAMRAEAVGDAIADAPVPYDALAIDEIKQALFELMQQPEVDTKAVKDLAGIIFKDRTTRIDQDKMDLLKQAAADAKAKLAASMDKAKSKGGISEETLREIEEAAGLL